MTTLSAIDLRRILPHRYPFLLIDRVIEIEPGVRAVGIKAVTVNEPFFQGHFPDYPVMPGVLIAEALAQVGAVAVLQGSDEQRIPFLGGLDGFRFKRQVIPGDTLRLEVELIQLRSRAGKGRGKATVDGDIVAEGEILFVLASVPPA